MGCRRGEEISLKVRKRRVKYLDSSDNSHDLIVLIDKAEVYGIVRGHSGRGDDDDADKSR